MSTSCVTFTNFPIVPLLRACVSSNISPRAFPSQFAVDIDFDQNSTRPRIIWFERNLWPTTLFFLLFLFRMFLLIIHKTVSCRPFLGGVLSWAITCVMIKSTKVLWIKMNASPPGARLIALVHLHNARGFRIGSTRARACETIAV